MKKILLCMCTMWLLGFSSHAQVLTPSHWDFKMDPQKVVLGDTTSLIIQVEIDEDWYLYSSDFSEDVGPMVTTFEFEPNDTYELVGEVRPIHPKRKYDELWEGEVSYFEHHAEFRQTVRILSESPVITMSYSFQVCTTVDGKCIPGDGEYVFDDIKVEKKQEPEPEKSKTSKITEQPKPQTAPVKVIEPELEDAEKEVAAVDSVQQVPEQKEVQTAVSEEVTSLPQPWLVRKPYDSYQLSGTEVVESLWAFAILAFLGGLAALLTPCVFPMIPMTVTFFTKSSGSRAAGIRTGILYALSIIVIYTIVGTILAWVNGPGFANWLSTHWVPNLLFFAVFFIFALSFLGLFEITMPSRFVNKVDQQSEKGGLLGVFFMAFTIVLVSFSCTGPIVGSILVASAGGEVIKPIVGMFAFSLAFALPFGLFAIFPHWLQGLPKSGGWLNSVKVVLGLLELALGLKFLSIADQVYHWGILDREIYLAFWVIIFALIGFYLLGKITLPHDSKMERVSVGRLILSIITFSFVVYLIPGMFGAPLKALSGYLPPMTSQDFNLIADPTTNEICEEPIYDDLFELPHGLRGYFDLRQALACAKEQHKPVFIDFTGHGCVNCREMEARVWSDPEVLARLKEDYVMVALYVDDKTKLSESQWYTSDYDGQVKKTIGKQFADYEITMFNNNAQPLYVLMDGDQNLLTSTLAYDLNVQHFVQFLDEGKAMFEKQP